jgi:hypothetical protein
MGEERHKRDQPRNLGQHHSHLQQQREPQVEERMTAACSRRHCHRLESVKGDTVMTSGEGTYRVDGQ